MRVARGNTVPPLEAKLRMQSEFGANDGMQMQRHPDAGHMDTTTTTGGERTQNSPTIPTQWRATSAHHTHRLFRHNGERRVPATPTDYPDTMASDECPPHLQVPPHTHYALSTLSTSIHTTVSPSSAFPLNAHHPPLTATTAGRAVAASRSRWASGRWWSGPPRRAAAPWRARSCRRR